MNESYREQHPLLCDELSEEEHFSFQKQRRYRPMVYRGRARNNLKGATAIITQWPEHWTSSLTYWWAGLSMIAITIFAIYNCVVAFALLPPSHTKSSRLRVTNKFDNTSNGTSLPDVFMHIFVNSNEEIDLNKYLPYIEEISNKYSDFKYNFIVVLNDTNKGELKTLTPEENNEIALNSLFTKKHILEKQKVLKNNINIAHTTLSDYMTGSPLKKDWRRVPSKFIKFLVRAISIWDKGGIAFNPTILTPHSSHIYKEKLRNILRKYQSCSEVKLNDTKTKTNSSKQKEKMKKRVNNIRDIIDILEHENGSFTSSQYSLTEAENKNIAFSVSSGRKLLSTPFQDSNNITYLEPPQEIKMLSSIDDDETNRQTDSQSIKTNNKTYDSLDKTTNTQGSEITESLENNKTSKLSLLPLFLEFLFHDKSKTNVHKLKEESSVSNVTRQRKSAISLDYIKRNLSAASIEVLNNTKLENYKPVIISSKGVKHDEIEKNEVNEVLDCQHPGPDQLTIDIKGNILATETPCHAFIGTVFSNIIHHTEEEALNDFIIAELSIFCKGLLSSCKGIDVILL